jgi:hypothetical protein
LMYYAITYGLTTVGAFGVVAVVEQGTGGETLSHFAGLSRRAPVRLRTGASAGGEDSSLPEYHHNLSPRGAGQQITFEGSRQMRIVGSKFRFEPLRTTVHERGQRH